MAARGTGKGRGRGCGRAVVPPTETIPSPSTSATPGSTQVASTPSPYLLVLNPDYHGPPPPPPPPVPPTVLGGHLHLHLLLFSSKNSPCTQEISNVIKLMYDQPWLKRKVIPLSTRHRMYKKWAEKFTWSKGHESTIKKNFDHRALKKFSGMMEDVRKRKEQVTQWCWSELKKALYHFCETIERYKHTEATNKANRGLRKSCQIYRRICYAYANKG
ncbi:hypothetical protein PIB30_057654 [Stylosanthes scabra]|uniref:Transposase n=1 Tax=Stylosanthes scabra TaxID=79078 RepID=A0ABU6YH52_9FABA|nr:hypothetical protein [Stylosanthes scabra]